MYQMGDGNEVAGGDAGPAISGLGDMIRGGITVGDYYGRGAQPAKGQNNQLLIIGAVVVVGLFLWTRKK